MTVTPVPGDVFCVRTNSIAARVIRLGASLRYLFSGGNNFRDLDNHIVIVSHQTDGVFWGIEGKPGGVGYADLTAYLNDRATVTNFDQPKTDEQRAQLLACIPQVLKAPYDWPAIMVSAALALHIPALFRQNWRGQGIPGHVICSSLAQFMYAHIGLAAPIQGRYTTPADWTVFCLERQWETA